MKKNQTKAGANDGYVIHSNGKLYVQIDDDSDGRWGHNQLGFSLVDEKGKYPGCFGLGKGQRAEWEGLNDDDPRLTPKVRERLGWILSEAEERRKADEEYKKEQVEAIASWLD